MKTGAAARKTGPKSSYNAGRATDKRCFCGLRFLDAGSAGIPARQARDSALKRRASTQS
jgi:hypothetical protein